MEPLSLPLPQFEPATSLCPGSTCIVIGHQNAGKTTLAYNLLQHVSGEDGFVVSHTRMPLYPRLCGRVGHWSDELHPERLVEFLSEHRSSAVAGPSFALLDCCIYDSATTCNPAFRALFEQSRSRQITVLLTMLYAMSLPPAIRAATDWVFFFREGIQSNVRRIYDMWFAGNAAAAYSFELIQAWTKDLPFYTCLVLNTQTGRLFQHMVAPLMQLPLSPSALAALGTLPTFQQTQMLQLGDYCVAMGDYSRDHATLLCALVPSDLSGGFLLQEPKGYPKSRAAYATIQNRVRTDVSGSLSQQEVALALANHLLDMEDLSGEPSPSFALLDSWFPADKVPFQFLFAHRQEKRILLLSCFWGHPALSAHRPDYLFCATVLDGLENLCPPSIPYDTFFDMMLALPSNQYLVLCQRTGAIMTYTPPPVTVSYR